MYFVSVRLGSSDVHAHVSNSFPHTLTPFTVFAITSLTLFLLILQNLFNSKFGVVTEITELMCLTLNGLTPSYSAFHCATSCVKLQSTVRSAVLSPVSSYTRHCVPPYQVQCRITLDSAFHCTTSCVELHSTMRSTLPRPVSSYTRQCVPLY